MKLSFPDRLNLANVPTPIQRLDRMSAILGIQIWVKRDDLTGSATSGNKVRKLEFTLARAKQQGADVLITCGGVQSNHCRATAILGAQLGFKVYLILRGEKPPSSEGNLMLNQIAGAEISYFSPKYYNAHLDFIVSELVEECEKRNQRPYFIPTGASDGTGVWGYLAAAEEISRQTETSFEQVVSATGSGGTQAGLTLGASIYLPGSRVTGMAVCDDESYFQEKVRQDIQSWSELYAYPVDIESLNIRVCDNYIGPGYARANPEIFECIELVARTEGLILDPVYTGKAFFGMLAEIEAGRLQGDNILFVHTGGIYGLLAQSAQYMKTGKN